MNSIKISKGLLLKIAAAVVVALLVGAVFVLKRASSTPTLAAGQAQQSAPVSPSFAEQAPAVPLPQPSTVMTAQTVAETGDLLITTPIDFAALRSSGLPVIIDFGADSCIPCKEMAPVLADLNASLKGKAIIRFVDVWKYRDLANGVPLQVIPTQVLFDSKGKPFTPPESLDIEFNMYSLKDSGEHVFTTHEGGLDKSQMLSILAAMGLH